MGDPNRRYRPVVNTPSVFPQVPNHHHQVYDVPTVYAEHPNHHHHHPHPHPRTQVYEIPTVFADVPNYYHHHQPVVFHNPSASTQNPNQQQHPPFAINVPTVGISAIPRAMISVVDYYLPDDTHNLYDVTFDTHTIHTLLTSSPSHVDSWLSDTFLHNRQNGYNRHRNNLIVGLDVEWRPNFHKNSNHPVATLQLCVGQRCLVFQILHSPYVPQSLIDFLGSAWNTFVGVGIEEDVEKLLEDYSLRVANFVDLRRLAVDVLGDREMGNAGLKRLSARVLGVEMEKPKRISRSRWDNAWLTAQQVQYACADAFVSFEVGRRLFGSC